MFTRKSKENPADFLNSLGKSKRGQTALEYLLIVVVAIIVVVAVMVWMNATSSTTVGTASRNTNEVLCRAVLCIDNTNCDASSACVQAGLGDCIGVTHVGAEIIPGHCEPIGLTGERVCNPTDLPTLTCSMFDSGFTGGSLSCSRGEFGWDVSDCYKTGTFNYLIDKDEWPSWDWWSYSYTSSGDTPCEMGPGGGPLAACSANPSSCMGQKIEITGGVGAPLGTYTIRDFAKQYFNSNFDSYIIQCPVLGADLISGGESSISWTYNLYGDPRPRNIIPECGNGIVEPEVGEVCDEGNLNSQTCGSIGRGYVTGGTLACKSNCLDWETSGCYYYEGTVLGSSDYSCCCGDLICIDYTGRCGGSRCEGKKVTFIGGVSSPSLSGTYSICASTRNIGGGIRVWQCSTPSEIALSGFNIAPCRSDRPCPLPNDGSGAIFRIHD